MTYKNPKVTRYTTPSPLLLSTGVLLTLSLSACADRFDSCEAKKACPDPAGETSGSDGQQPDPGAGEADTSGASEAPEPTGAAGATSDTASTPAAAADDTTHASDPASGGVGGAGGAAPSDAAVSSGSIDGAMDENPMGNSMGDGTTADNTVDDSGSATTTGGPDLATDGSATSPEPESECQNDTDCSDGLFCNGEETCVAGSCTPGLSPCAGDEPAHCLVVCREPARTCEVLAQDADADGYGSAACSEAPGDDCDDSDPAIHPNAAEMCDGIDNDCNALVDLADGLPLAGTNRSLSGSMQADVAYSPTQDEFAVVYRETATLALSMGALDANGITPTQRIAGPKSLTSFSNGSIAWGDGEFGISFHQSDDYDDVLHFGTTTSVSTPPSDLTQASQIADDLAYREDGAWLIASRPRSGGGIQVYSATSSGFVPGALIASSAVAPRIATSGQQAALIWQALGADTIHWSRLSTGLAASSPVSLTSAGVGPDIAGSDDSYWVAWGTPSGIRVSKLTLGGALSCGTDVPFAENLASHDFDSVRLAVEGDRVYALVTRFSGAVGLTVIASDCQLEHSFDIGGLAEKPRYPSIAVGGGSLGLTWTEQPPVGGQQTRSRVMAERLCE